MVAPLKVRLTVLATVLVPAALIAWSYVATHDVAGLWHDLQNDRPPTWPPARKEGARGPVDVVRGTADGALGVLPIGAALIVAMLLIVCGSRARARHGRKQAMTRWELLLGRDDLANPYRVQEAFEGLCGAISPRWYERLWRGADHFALEIHRLEDATIHFAIAGPRSIEAAARGRLEDLYPDTRLVERRGEPAVPTCVVRLKKRRSFVLSLQTTREYDHSFVSSLVALLARVEGQVSVQLVVTPAPAFMHRRARRLLKGRERSLTRREHRDRHDLGIDSVIENKELRGALETQHRSLLITELRVSGTNASAVHMAAGLTSELRNENELGRHQMRLRRDLYAQRIATAMPNPIPGLRVGLLSTSELATLWHLPSGRVKHARLTRAPVRRATAGTDIDRDEATVLLVDEEGPVTLASRDRKYGHALIGGQGGGKSSVMARHFANDARDPDRAVVLIDPKGPLAELCLGMAPADRTVHYLDLGRPEIGINPLTVDASPGARASLMLHALVEANPVGAIQASSDNFLRQAFSAVCTVEAEPTLWHVHRLLDPTDATYRRTVVSRLADHDGVDFALRFWQKDFPAMLANRSFTVQALNPPRNKLERLISTQQIDALLRHPHTVDIDQVLESNEILIVAGAKASVGEDNTILVTQILLQLIQRALQARQANTESAPVSLLVDEAHNVLTPSVARMLAEGRAAGLEAVFAWQFSAQIRDEVIRSGVRSLLQSISIFRMREMEDARSLSGLAMEIYSDRISVDAEEQERLRFSADDIVRLPAHHAINLWLADGVPRPGFIATTLPMEDLHDESVAEAHRDAQRDRGGHQPASLDDPIQVEAEPEVEAAKPSTPPATAKAKAPAVIPGQQRLPEPEELEE